MDLSWSQSFIYGLLAGLTDILPVSAQAHRALLLKFFGISTGTALLDFFIHLAVAGALYICCQSHLIRISRAVALSRVPKRRRKRPLDVRSLMDLSLLRTMLIPVVLALFARSYALDLGDNLMLLALFLLLNGVVLYIPQFFPTGNRDSRTLSRVEGFLMGLGGAASVVPGFSAMGLSTAVGSVCGIERGFTLNMALLMNMGLNIGLAVCDLAGLLSAGDETVAFGLLLRYLATALVTFAATMLAVRLMRRLASGSGYSLFGLYCLGLSLFTFILNLMA